MRKNLLSSTIKIFTGFSEARRRGIGDCEENLNTKSLCAKKKREKKGVAPPAPSQD
jgi:hypothetical protein